ncbi:hypothetical protein R6G69_07440 [Actinotignum urinale]|uniref:hypothetical protein n=1 Tax=Actinotignum urinale TaxID=190146 RepID=UPI002A81B249|nr:hypothetical protein [Actinotignum urinale]MDY5129806.1 hypothetical protein [Actinotignum urinale]
MLTMLAMEVDTKSGWETNILGWFTIDWWLVLWLVLNLAAIGFVLCIILGILALAGVPIMLVLSFLGLAVVAVFNIVVWVCIGLWKILTWIWSGCEWVYEGIKESIIAYRVKHNPEYAQKYWQQQEEARQRWEEFMEQLREKKEAYDKEQAARLTDDTTT